MLAGNPALPSVSYFFSWDLWIYSFHRFGFILCSLLPVSILHFFSWLQSKRLNLNLLNFDCFVCSSFNLYFSGSLFRRVFVAVCLSLFISFWDIDSSPVKPIHLSIYLSVIYLFISIFRSLFWKYFHFLLCLFPFLCFNNLGMCVSVCTYMHMCALNVLCRGL